MTLLSQADLRLMLASTSRVVARAAARAAAKAAASGSVRSKRSDSAVAVLRLFIQQPIDLQYLNPSEVGIQTFLQPSWSDAHTVRVRCFILGRLLCSRHVLQDLRKQFIMDEEHHRLVRELIDALELAGESNGEHIKDVDDGDDDNENELGLQHNASPHSASYKFNVKRCENDFAHEFAEFIMNLLRTWLVHS